MTYDRLQLIKMLFIATIALLSSVISHGNGAEAAVKKENVEPISPASVSANQPISLQKQESLKLFKKIFELSSDKQEAGHFDRIAKLYNQIIQNCPDAPLAQESYFKLIELYFSAYTPPLQEKATELFGQFKRSYPESRLFGVIKYAMAKGYFACKSWQDLAQLESSPVAEYFATGKIDTPLSLFYYSEAKYNLGEIEEATKGYRALVENFPETLVARTAENKIVRIERHGK